jgi:hypothetical protein
LDSFIEHHRPTIVAQLLEASGYHDTKDEEEAKPRRVGALVHVPQWLLFPGLETVAAETRLRSSFITKYFGTGVTAVRSALETEYTADRV